MSGPDPERPLVLKFGGACFLNLEDYRTAAKHITGRLSEHRRIVAVVSAMSGTTGNLQNAQRDLHSQPPADLTAALLVTADTVSAILLATALCEFGVNARSVEAREEGMSAEGSPERAQLTRIDPAPLWAALSNCEVVTMPGGQAINEHQRVVTLGRNSSDLSAVAAAVALNARSCEIFSDVPGVFTADPYLLPEARVIGELGYGTARRMSRAGAKVLHPSAVDLAQRHGLPIVCRTRPPDGTRGTVISAAGTPAVIIADMRSAVWAFPDVAALGRARERLVSEGLDPVVLDYDGVRHLIVPGGDSSGVAHGICAAAMVRADLRLLTTVHGEQEPEHVLVHETDLLEEARRRHKLHYPSFEPPPSGKQRSALSSMLLDSKAVAVSGPGTVINEEKG